MSEDAHVSGHVSAGATESMRTFDTGATRTSDVGKLDYEAFLSPLVLKRYAEYLNEHRVQADGKIRDGDNWQKGFGEKHYDVCMKSAWRHFMDMWTMHRGIAANDVVETKRFQNSMCAVLFNVMAYLHQELKGR